MSGLPRRNRRIVEGQLSVVSFRWPERERGRVRPEMTPQVRQDEPDRSSKRQTPGILRMATTRQSSIALARLLSAQAIALGQGNIAWEVAETSSTPITIRLNTQEGIVEGLTRHPPAETGKQ